MSRPSSRPTPLRAPWTRTQQAGRNIGELVTATDPENDTLTYSLDVDGAASFDINKDTGQLQTKADLDFETGTATYSVTVTATDTAGATGTITVTITVTNLDEAGTVTLSSLQPQVRFQLTATLDDPDDVRGSVTWLWAGSPNGSSSSWTTISGATSAAYTPVTADLTRYLRATASYTDGEDSGKSAQVVSANRVQPAPVAPNDPPLFPSNTADARRGREHVTGRGHRRARHGHRPRGQHPDLLPGRRRRGLLRHQ